MNDRPSYALPARLHLRQQDNLQYAQWERTMFHNLGVPLADRVEKAPHDLEAWFASEQRTRAVEQVHIAEQDLEVAS